MKNTIAYALLSLTALCPACVGSVDVEPPPQEDTETVACDDSVTWTSPIFQQTLNASDASTAGPSFVQGCEEADAIAVKNNKICEGKIPPQTTGVYCNSLINDANVPPFTCASLEADNGMAFGQWVQGLTVPMSCIVTFTAAP